MLVPCFNCLKNTSTENKNILAKLCLTCINSKKLTKILKYLTIDKLNKSVKMFNKKQKTEFGKLTKYGEII